MTPDERAAQWCGCGHRRTAHTFADLGECAGCPNGTCLSPFTEQLSWTDTDARDEIRRLQADAREAESLIDTLSGLLDGVAVALRGPAEPGTLHDWSRLPRESDEARAALDRVRALCERAWYDESGKAVVSRDAIRSAIDGGAS